MIYTPFDNESVSTFFSYITLISVNPEKRPLLFLRILIKVDEYKNIELIIEISIAKSKVQKHHTMPRCASLTKSGQRCKVVCKHGERTCRMHEQTYEKDNEIENATCPICLETISYAKEHTILVCKHVFCKPCISAWLRSAQTTCPMCRKEVTFKEFITLLPKTLHTASDNNPSLTFQLALQTPVPNEITPQLDYVILNQNDTRGLLMIVFMTIIYAFMRTCIIPYLGLEIW